MNLLTEKKSAMANKNLDRLKIHTSLTVISFSLNKMFRVIFLLYACLTPFLIKAQGRIQKENKKYIHDSVEIHKIPHNTIDIIDVANLLRGKEIASRHYTPDAKLDKPHLSAAPAAGYTLANGFAVAVSANLAFYAYDSSNQKISNITTSITYTQKHQMIFPLSVNYWTKGNKYNFVSEWRYMKYPSPNFQVPNNNDVSNYTIDFSLIKIHQSILRSVARNFYAGVGYYLDFYKNIQELDLPPNTVTSFQTYGLSSSEVASGMVFRLLYDSRLNQINANNGIYVNLEYHPNYTWLGSDNNWQSLLLDVRKYFKLSPTSRNILAFWSYNLFTVSGMPPYLMLPSTGWDEGGYNTGRGYVQSRFRGRNMLYLEAEYRFRITNNGLIGGVLFMNTQAFTSNTDNVINTIAPGWGTGLRVKFNKFSRTNIAIDYGFGLNGSSGFFVNLGEVF
jgi:hypothetical protein